MKYNILLLIVVSSFSIHPLSFVYLQHFRLISFYRSDEPKKEIVYEH